MSKKLFSLLIDLIRDQDILIDDLAGFCEADDEEILNIQQRAAEVLALAERLKLI